MTEKNTVKLTHWDYDTNTQVEDGEVDLGKIAKCMTKENFAYLLETHCNSFNCEYNDGKIVGKLLQGIHPTLQATVFRYFMGIISGIGEDRYVDGRNEMAVACAKKISDMVDNGELKIGWMI